jgi:uncharacterized protein (TIGR01319 family)
MESDSVLVIDVGAVTTRAMLYDVVDGRYRFLAMGTSPSTAGSPFHDVGEGVRCAIDALQATTGRLLVDSSSRLIMPSKSDGSGVDICAATLSAGKPLRVVAVGLLEEVSAESAQQLATTTYAEVVERLSLNDRRSQTDRLDAIVRARPDLIIMAGGTEGGASHSVLNLLEAVGLACYLLPTSEKPEVLFAGNSELMGEVDSAIAQVAHLSVAPNIRPAIEVEQLAPAQKQLSQIYRTLRSRQIIGVNELNQWTGNRLAPASAAFGRMIRFLSKVYDPAKGVMGIDLGASATTLAASFSGDLVVGIYPDLGLGVGLPDMLDVTSTEEIQRWLPIDLPEADLRDYMHNKALYPGRVPSTEEELALEQALARRAIQLALKRLTPRFPKPGSGDGLLPPFEPVLATGSVLGKAPLLGQSLLMVLDGMQPVGVTTIVLDQNGLAAGLGAVAEVNQILPIQILESNTFLNLGTVISPVGNTALGSPALRVKVAIEGGNETSLEVKHGALELISLPPGKPATLHLQPLNRFDVGMGGPGRGGSVRVVGGALGVVIDARGRPLRLPSDPGRRRDLLKKWLWTFGG